MKTKNTEIRKQELLKELEIIKLESQVTRARFIQSLPNKIAFFFAFAFLAFIIVFVPFGIFAMFKIVSFSVFGYLKVYVVVGILFAFGLMIQYQPRV